MHKKDGDNVSDMYNVIIKHCESRRISGYRLCKDIGIQPSILTDLKMGRQKSLNTANAQKIADYFGISVGELLGNEQKETPTPKSERDIENEEIIKKLESDEALRAAVLRFLGM